MAEVLVTGGTGVLGCALVPALRAAGHGVRVLSRRPGDGHLVGDLRTGTGIAEAVAGVDTVVHAATSPRKDLWAVDVAGTRRLAVAARDAGVRHFVYVSIPGVDKAPYPYYRAKYAAEQVVAAAGVRHTVLRATQFHPLVAALLRAAHKAFLLPIGRGWRTQPVDVADVADHLVERVAVGPADGGVEFGGPDVREAADLARAWLAARGAAGASLSCPSPAASARRSAAARCCPPRTPRAAQPAGRPGWPGPAGTARTRPRTWDERPTRVDSTRRGWLRSGLVSTFASLVLP